MPQPIIHAGKIDYFEAMIEQGRCLEVTLNDQSILKFYPRKVIELTGELNVIGEHIEKRCLVDISFSNISTFSETDQDYSSNFSDLAIDDFITNIREIEGSDSRLVLKIDHCLQKIEPPQGFQHLGKTFVTTNGNGDHIWAATVESSVTLMEWLYSMRHVIEILNPQAVKEDYYRYCHYLENKGA